MCQTYNEARLDNILKVFVWKRSLMQALQEILLKHPEIKEPHKGKAPEED